MYTSLLSNLTSVTPFSVLHVRFSPPCKAVKAFVLPDIISSGTALYVRKIKIPPVLYICYNYVDTGYRGASSWLDTATWEFVKNWSHF